MRLIANVPSAVCGRLLQRGLLSASDARRSRYCGGLRSGDRGVNEGPGFSEPRLLAFKAFVGELPPSHVVCGSARRLSHVPGSLVCHPAPSFRRRCALSWMTSSAFPEPFFCYRHLPCRFSHREIIIVPAALRESSPGLTGTSIACKGTRGEARGRPTTSCRCDDARDGHPDTSPRPL
jgi:hypothetical protein